MKILRTPDARFEKLPDFDYPPQYAQVNNGLRLHYVDAGPEDGPPVLLLHGEPTWSFLYRKMIPVFTGAGFRVLAPDLIGFGRSDKPAAAEDYSYQRHVDWIRDWMRHVDPHNLTLFGQDWGSLIGLRLVAAEPDRFARVVIGNGFLPTGDERVPSAFKIWRAFAIHSPVFPVAGVLRAGSKSRLPRAVRRAYKAPFPDRRYLAGARAFPALVPITPDDPASEANREAWKVLEQWHKPFHTAFADGDPITRGADRRLRERIPGAKNSEHTTIRGAGHFLQEDKGEDLAHFIVDQMKSQ